MLGADIGRLIARSPKGDAAILRRLPSRGTRLSEIVAYGTALVTEPAAR
jgi:hypothetical protein